MTPVTFIPLRMAGPLRDGEPGKGTIWHAVAFVLGDEARAMSPVRKALCGTQPAIQWTSDPGDAVTCAKCLRKANEMGVQP